MIKIPRFVLEYTHKTIDAVLSPAALQGQQVEVDVYDRTDVNRRYVGIGQRINGDEDIFRVVVNEASVDHTDEWNYTLLRESASRSRGKRK